MAALVTTVGGLCGRVALATRYGPGLRGRATARRLRRHQMRCRTRRGSARSGCSGTRRGNAGRWRASRMASSSRIFCFQVQAHDRKKRCARQTVDYRCLLAVQRHLIGLPRDAQTSEVPDVLPDRQRSVHMLVRSPASAPGCCTARSATGSGFRTLAGPLRSTSR